MTARNKPAFERGQAIRAAIRALLASRSPLLPPLSAKAVREALHLTISVRAVRWHVAAIRLEAVSTELACRRGNSSSVDGTLG